MRTGAHLKIQRRGDNALGVDLEGDPRKPEPIHFRVSFPGGDVDVVRCDNGDYWVHVHVERPGRTSDAEGPYAKLADARLDIEGRHTSDVNVGDFADPNLYHLAVRVTADKE